MWEEMHMHLRTFARCSASVAALAALSSAPAWAQDAPAADATSAASGQTAASTDPADDTIVVTGLRRSLQSAQNLKRNSDQIIDAIVAQDIGKLPDIAVSDTAARIPGIQ